jgi:hypothetical protein
MALDYYLLVDTSLTTDQVLSIILELDGLKKNDKENTFFVDWLIGGVSKESDDDKRLNQKEFGLSSTINIWFNPIIGDDENEAEKTMKDMMRVVMRILQIDLGDAILLFNGDSLVLSRFNGKLLLDSDNFAEKNRWWNPNHEVPFEMYQIKNLN